ncbi:MAG: nucleotide pyrophosphohydrolase [Bdellovibrionota bacterium]
MDIKTLTQRIINFRDARNWQQFHSPKDMILGLLCEVGELAEHFKWATNKEILESLNKTEIADELSDVLYWVLLIANDLDINLAENFESKMKKNELKYPVEKFKDSY